MNADQTAILYVAVQNETCRPGGRLHEWVRDQLQSREIFPNIIGLMEEGRKKNIRMVQCPFVYDTQLVEQHGARGVLSLAREMRTMRRGTWGCEVVEEMRVKKDQGDLGIEGFCALSAFARTDLEGQLRAADIKHVAVCGFMAAAAVYATAKDAFDLGFSVTILSDAIGAVSDVNHRFVCEELGPLVGQVRTSEAFLEQFD